MLPQVNPLPSPEKERAIFERKGRVCHCQCRSNMSWHIIGTLKCVSKDRIAIRTKAREKPLQILAHFGIGIFLNQKRRRSMRNMQRQCPVSHSDFGVPRAHNVRDFIKPAPLCQNNNLIKSLPHKSQMKKRILKMNLKMNLKIISRKSFHKNLFKMLNPFRPNHFDQIVLIILI